MDAPKTIRDEIQRQARPAKWTGIALGVGVGIAITVLRKFSDRVSPFAGLLLAFGPMAVIVIAVLFYKRLGYRVACPKCKTPLSAFAYAMQDGRQGPKINFCPYCAVNLDDPIPEAPTQAEQFTTPDKLVWK